ncbi:radical SAM protein [Stygiolobus caldivivus]|uniref:Radical SAM protein n=1 Tax=Stygiolobus caldivivus TaxID=2824673 RepID=A0A8D5U4H7_9CREN|nr:radical SAM protein [Stygiolobus caldivivus]BCU69102.1 radical SAM protein [Stygiolobus caldivivus]
MKVLVSAGTYYFIKKQIKISNTAYLLQTGGCRASCKFCTQSALSTADKTYLSRVKWYPLELEEIKDYLSTFDRVCLQTVIKEGFEDEVIKVLSKINSRHKSVTITPVSDALLLKLKELGVDYLGVGLDTVKSLWKEVGKPYSFDYYMDFIKRAVKVFGARHVYVHLIVGLGESEGELVNTMEELYSIGAEVALFAFTPVKGTPFESKQRPPLEYYRKIQKIRYRLSTGKDSEIAFLTSGCPSCDRPYYNESPLDRTLYNIPLRDFKWS